MRPPAAPLLVAVLLSGCSAHGDQAALDRWHRAEPAAYSYSLVGSAMSGPSRTTFTVRDGRVIRVEESRPGVRVPEPLTVDGVFAQLARDRRTAARVQVSFDPAWGFPTSVAVDRNSDSVDDEYSYGVHDFRPLSG